MATATRGNGQRGAVTYEREPEPPRHDDDGLLERVVEATVRERYSLEEVNYMAKAVHMSGLYGMNQAQALTLMLLAEADGQHPMHALRRYHLMSFGGRVTPTMKAEAMLADMMKAGWRHEWLTESGDRTRQEIHLIHATKCPKGKTVCFSEEDAKKAKLLDGTNKEMWDKHRPNMLRARTVSNACRMLDPGIVLGVYTPEETADMGGQDERTGTAPAAKSRVELRSALDDARRPAQPTLPAPPRVATPETPRTEFGAWLDTILADANAELRDAAQRAGVAPPKPIERYHVSNHLASAWIAEGTLSPAVISKDGTAEGPRDQKKTTRAMLDAVKAEAEPVMDEIREYVPAKVASLAAEAGFTLGDPDASDDQQGMADEDQPEEALAN